MDVKENCVLFLQDLIDEGEGVFFAAGGQILQQNKVIGVRGEEDGFDPGLAFDFAGLVGVGDGDGGGAVGDIYGVIVGKHGGWRVGVEGVQQLPVGSEKERDFGVFASLNVAVDRLDACLFHHHHGFFHDDGFLHNNNGFGDHDSLRLWWEGDFPRPQATGLWGEV